MSRILRKMEAELGRARKKYDQALNDVSTFGRYDDCGDDYRSDYKEAKAVKEYLEGLLPQLRNLCK